MARNSGRKSKAEEAVEEEVEDQEEEQEGEEDGEYEIEAVVLYKSDAFKDPFEGGYKVKWKGYDEKDNSWVRPSDALGAWDLIEEYWQKRGKKNPHAHLKPEPEENEDEEMQDVEATPEPEPEPAPAPKKRGRPSKAASSPERRKSEPTEESEPKKRGRKSNGATTASAPPTKKARRTSSPAPPVVTETVVHPTKLANWKNRENWDNSIIEITTIEHDKEKLYVYFKLKGLKDPCSEPLEVCRKRFPTKLLDFYEKNLRWRSVEGSDAEDN
ncbi:unnamed protein product [Peniophora sp. CBMAI 1063]|nr:unnamed protein product [Peniophora sp. CBMAI 1063]